MPRAAHFKPPKQGSRAGAERIVYFPSCAARTMGAQRGDDTEALPAWLNVFSAKPDLTSFIRARLRNCAVASRSRARV